LAKMRCHAPRCISRSRSSVALLVALWWWCLVAVFEARFPVPVEARRPLGGDDPGTALARSASAPAFAAAAAESRARVSRWPRSSRALSSSSGSVLALSDHRRDAGGVSSEEDPQGPMRDPMVSRRVLWRVAGTAQARRSHGETRGTRVRGREDESARKEKSWLENLFAVLQKMFFHFSPEVTAIPLPPAKRTTPFPSSFYR
jgi:hypothetical protein